MAILTPSEFTDITKEIVEANGDQAKLTSLLVKVQDGYSELYASHSTVTDENKETKKENERLKAYNFELFMEHGKNLVEKNKETEENEKEKTRGETIKIADLFNKEDK